LPTDTTRGQQSLFVLAILVAAALRLYQVHEQILGGDEMHSVNSVRNHGLMWIFLHIGTADHCIPLTLLNELISETFGMNEMWMRAPSLMAGIGAVIVLPPLLAPDKELAEILRQVHQVTVYALLALIALHTVAALFRQLVLKDGGLRRMLGG